MQLVSHSVVFLVAIVACAETCPFGMRFETCGSGCGPASCDNLDSRLICPAMCFKGCFCPAGFVKNQDGGTQCIRPAQCQGKPMRVKLFDGPCKTEGRLEVYDGSDYGTVCEEQITDLDARVICRQLGFEYENAEVVTCCDTYPAARVGVSDLFGVLNCTGEESMIAECPHPPVGSREGCTSVRHVNDVGIRCKACQIKKMAVIVGAIAFIIIVIVVAVVLWYVCYFTKK